MVGFASQQGVFSFAHLHLQDLLAWFDAFVYLLRCSPSFLFETSCPSILVGGNLIHTTQIIVMDPRGKRSLVVQPSVDPVVFAWNKQYRGMWERR